MIRKYNSPEQAENRAKRKEKICKLLMEYGWKPLWYSSYGDIIPIVSMHTDLLVKEFIRYGKKFDDPKMQMGSYEFVFMSNFPRWVEMERVLRGRGFYYEIPQRHRDYHKSLDNGNTWYSEFEDGILRSI